MAFAALAAVEARAGVGVDADGGGVVPFMVQDGSVGAVAGSIADVGRGQGVPSC